MVHDNYNRICFRWAFVHQNSYINNCFKLLETAGSWCWNEFALLYQLFIRGNRYCNCRWFIIHTLTDQRLLPMEVDQSTYLYSNLLLLFSGIIVISWLVTLNVYKHSQRDF